MMRLLILLQCLCASVYARSKVNGLLNVEEVCDVEVTRGFRQSRDQFELITTLSMDHEHFRACIMIDPKQNFMERLVCNAHIRENFPANLAIDPVELKLLESKYNYRAFTPTAVDPSESTNTSSPFQLDLLVADVWPNPDWIGYPSSLDLVLHMPIHPRVHTPPPAAGVKEVEFVIPPPSRVALRCENPRMLQVWDPVEKRKLHVQKAPHGLNYGSSSMGSDIPSVAYNTMNAMVTADVFEELKVVETEPFKFRVAADSLPTSHAVRPRGLEVRGGTPIPIGLTVGVGGTAVLLIVLAIYKVLFGSDSNQSASAQANKAPSTGKSKSSSSNSSQKKLRKVD